MDPSARLAADGLELDRVHPQIMEVLPLFLFYLLFLACALEMRAARALLIPFFLRAS